MSNPRKRRPGPWLPLAALAWLAGAPALRADTVVVPAGLESVDGNAANSLPFAKSNVVSNNPYRYQQVYAASDFVGITGPIAITELRFRTDQPLSDSSPVDIEAVDVRLSTTQMTPDNLDNVNFDNNLGPDVTLVYSGGLSWDACGPGPTACPPAPANPFDLPIHLSPGFLYDPTQGNLLLEVINNSTTFPVGFFLDYQNVQGDSVSRVVEVVNPTNGTHTIVPVGSFSGGMVTLFVYHAPEPSAVATGLAGLLALGALARRGRALSAR